MPKPPPTSSTRWHQERWRSRHGINLAFGENGKVALVVTDKGTYPADIVTLCVNFKPNSALYEDADFTVPPNRALVVNHHQETSKPGVYAIGDALPASTTQKTASAPTSLWPPTQSVPAWATAAADTALESRGGNDSSGICIYSFKMVSTGLAQGAALKAGYNAEISDYTKVQKAIFIETSNPEFTVRIVYDTTTRRLLGAQVASTYDMSADIHMFSLVPQEHLTIDRRALTDIFFLPPFNQPYNYYRMVSYQAVLKG